MPTAPCPACGSTSRVTIGKKDYCTNCGAQLTGETDKPAALPSVTPLPNAAAATAVVPAAPTPTPTEPGTAVQVNPAQAFHAKPAPSNHVLDLRKAPVTPPPTPAVNAPAAVSVAPTSPAVAPAISKFHNPNAKIAAAPTNDRPTEQPEKVVMPPAPAPAVAAPATPAAPAPAPTPPVNDIATPKDMPAPVSTAISGNQSLLTAAKNAATPAPAAPRPASMAVAAVGLVLLGGYVWLKNYPNLAIRVAATKAGIAAAAPAYLPAGYSLSGQVTYGPGEVTTNFNSPSGTGTLTIVQRRTSWDSDSLLDNFVARQGNDFLAVQREGLTVYFYGQNQVTWINHGIWYTIQGTNKLNRDQVLSIVDSL